MYEAAKTTATSSSDAGCWRDAPFCIAHRCTAAAAAPLPGLCRCRCHMPVPLLPSDRVSTYNEGVQMLVKCVMRGREVVDGEQLLDRYRLRFVV